MLKRFLTTTLCKRRLQSIRRRNFYELGVEEAVKYLMSFHCSAEFMSFMMQNHRQQSVRFHVFFAIYLIILLLFLLLYLYIVAITYYR